MAVVSAAALTPGFALTTIWSKAPPRPRSAWAVETSNAATVALPMDVPPKEPMPEIVNRRVAPSIWMPMLSPTR